MRHTTNKPLHLYYSSLGTHHLFPKPMANPNPIPIRPWSHLASSLRSAPIPHSNTNPQTLQSKPAQPSLQARNSSSPPSKFNFVPHNETKILVEQEPNSVLHVNANGSLAKESGETQNKDTKVTTKENEMKGKDIDTEVLGSEACVLRVITIAGENRGAYMQITKSQKKPIQKKENSGNGEVNANMKDKSGKVGTQSSPPLAALYANSNVQCVNNSMVFHSSCNYHDPGVHLILSKKPFGKHVDDQRN